MAVEEGALALTQVSSSDFFIQHGNHIQSPDPDVCEAELCCSTFHLVVLIRSRVHVRVEGGVHVQGCE